MKNQQTDTELITTTNKFLTTGGLCIALGIVTIIVWAISNALFPINMVASVAITATSVGCVIVGIILVLIGFVCLLPMMGTDTHDTP